MTTLIRRMRRRAAALVAVLLGMGCSSATAAEPGCDAVDDGALRVLFIGNSLTYFNGMPYMFAALADSVGESAPVVQMIAFPNFGLPEQWQHGQAPDAIRDGCWDVVVLQQGPSSLAESRAVLLDYAARFAELVHANGGRTALLSVWPSASRQADFDRTIESYALAAQTVDGVLLPAATAWLETWEREPQIRLYADALHPTPEGSYLAAAVTIARLYGRSPTELPAGVEYRIPDEGRHVLSLDVATADVLREAATAALERHPDG